MPGYCSDADSLAIKVLSFFPDNTASHSLPVLQGTVLLFDPRNGVLKAVSGARLSVTIFAIDTS